MGGDGRGEFRKWFRMKGRNDDGVHEKVQVIVFGGKTVS
jgi:hypothetical protein